MAGLKLKGARSLVRLARGQLAYNAERKARFPRSAATALRQIARDLGLDEADVRINRGGIAVSGEAMLHADHLYVQLDQSCVGDRFMFRGCSSKTDYCGHCNQWMPWQKLVDDYPGVLAAFRVTYNTAEYHVHAGLTSTEGTERCRSSGSN